MNRKFFTDIKLAVEADQVESVLELINQFGKPTPEHLAHAACLFSSVRSVAMTELLLNAGLTVAMVGEWWASGFGLNEIPVTVSRHLVARGAVLTPHAAAALGLVEELRAMFDHEPGLVHSKGGDGGRPLHFSRDVATATLLVERGAALDPRDDDHDSTPAQWRIGDAPEVTRYLLGQGAVPDIFMAAALGDLELARQLVGENPACTGYRIGNNQGPFPGIGSKGGGGTIYQWTLGFNQSPQEIAHHRGHRAVYDYLMLHTPPRPKLLIACMLVDRPLANEIVAQSPGLLNELDAEDRSLLAKCCWETNINPEAVRLMLDLGFPVDVPERNHGYMALHNAAWCGHAGLVELLLQRGHPVDRRDPGYQSTPLGFAIHSCVVAGRHPEGEFPRVVQLLLEAGSPLDPHQFPSGHDGIDAVIQRHKQSSRGSHETSA